MLCISVLLVKWYAFCLVLPKEKHFSCFSSRGGARSLSLAFCCVCTATLHTAIRQVALVPTAQRHLIFSSPKRICSVFPSLVVPSSLDRNVHLCVKEAPHLLPYQHTDHTQGRQHHLHFNFVFLTSFSFLTMSFLTHARTLYCKLRCGRASTCVHWVL